MATLSATTNTATTTIALDTGTDYWIKWQQAGTSNHKTTGSGISDRSAVGSYTEAGYNNDPRTIGWANGTPTASGSDAEGIYSGGTAVDTNGFSFTLTADTNIRTYKFYFGNFGAAGRFSATLNDGSASMSPVDFSDPGNASQDCNIVLTVQAASTTTVTMTWVILSHSLSFGNVTINGASLAITVVASTSIGQPSAPAFLMIGPGRFRSPMGIGRSRASGSQATSLALTGISATGSAGTPVSNISYAQIGSAGTSAAGTPVSNISYSTTGNAATASAGAPVSNISQVSTGSSATASAGTLRAALSYALTGSQVTSAAGTVVSAIANALVGTSASTSAGTVLASIAGALSGSGATSSAGTPKANISLSATGTGLTTTAGTVTVGNNVNISLAGQSMTISAGTPGVTVTIPIAGLGLTVHAGTVTESGGSTVTFARNAILFSGDKSIRPTALEWKRTHEDN